MNDRLRKVIALMDSPTESEAAAAFRKARALLEQGGRRFRDLLGHGGTGAPTPTSNGGSRYGDGYGDAADEILALRERIATLEWCLQEANARAESAHGGLDVVERHLDGLDRKYKAALEQKDRAIAKLRRQLAQQGGERRAARGHDRPAAADPGARRAAAGRR